MRTTNKSDDGEQKKRGRPPIQINMEMVETLASIQCTDEEIAAALRVSVDTIARRKQNPEFAEALAAGKALGRMSLRRLQWQAAKGGSVPMMIWLGKQMLGQRDRWDEPTENATEKAKEIASALKAMVDTEQGPQQQ
jgi:hypothetical protein